MQVSRLCLAVSVVLPVDFTVAFNWRCLKRLCSPKHILGRSPSSSDSALCSEVMNYILLEMGSADKSTDREQYFIHRWSLGDILVRLYATTWQPRGCYYPHANLPRDSSRLRVQYSGVLSPGWVEMQSCKNRSSIDVGGFPPDFRVLRSMIYLTDFTS